MTAHLHPERVDGCYRCEIGADEAAEVPECVDSCDDWTCRGGCAFDELTAVSQQAGLYDQDSEDRSFTVRSLSLSQCVHCRGSGCMSPTNRGAHNACCICGDPLPAEEDA